MRENTEFTLSLPPLIKRINLIYIHSITQAVLRFNHSHICGVSVHTVCTQKCTTYWNSFTWMHNNSDMKHDVMCMVFGQAWRVLTAVLQRRPQTVPPPLAAGRSGVAGQQRLGGGARTVIASAVHHLIHWAPPPPVALAGQGVGPEPRALTLAGTHTLPPHQGH